MSLSTHLEELERRIAATDPAFSKTLEGPAPEAELATLRAELELPDDVAAWFAWHAGSERGFIPGTSFGLIYMEEVLSELRFARSADGPPELVSTRFVPLLTGRNGNLIYYVVTETGDGAIWEYARGTRVKTTSFATWFETVCEAWRAEGTTLRVPWVRRQRSPMGWHLLQLPARARPRLRTLLAHLPITIDEGRVDGAPAITMESGDTPSWRVRADASECVEIVLTAAGVDELALAVADKKQSTIRVPGLDDLRIALVDR